MEKNEEYKGEVLSLGSEGEGIIKCGEERAFVPFCLPGEEVSFRALKVGGGVCYGKLTEVHTLSPHRVLPVCPHFEKCGGCQLQHMDYPTQLAFKRDAVKSCLEKLGGLHAEVGETEAGSLHYGYRNKLALPVGVDAQGGTAVGFYAPRSHRIVPINSCALQPEWSDILIDCLKKFMKESGLSGYDEESGRGDIRHIVGREVGGKLVITVVAAHPVGLRSFTSVLDGRLRNYTLWLNINNSRGNAVMGGKFRLVKGNGYFSDKCAGIRFKVGAETFLQVNDEVREKLYSAICACVKGDEVAIDLYSGGGLLTAMLAKSCKAAYGVEIVAEAVGCADELKKENGLDGKMFNICGAVEDKISGVLAKTAGEKRVIVCDPPRKGMERSVVYETLKSGAEKIVLVSCNPATLARDLGILCGSLKEADGRLVKNPAYTGKAQEGFYEILSVTPYDMFPQTKHVETLVILERK